MLTFLVVSQALSWLIILALGAAVLALARQVGVLHVRVAPAGALTPASGPRVGEASPVMDLESIDGSPVSIGRPRANTRLQLLMFVSPMCPICKDLIPVAKSFARREGIDVIFVGDDEISEQRRMIADLGIGGIPFVNGPQAGRTFQVDKLPHAVLLNQHGFIVSKGLVNSREHLESLVVSHEMKMESVQDYIVSIKQTTI